MKVEIIKIDLEEIKNILNASECNVMRTVICYKLPGYYRAIKFYLDDKTYDVYYHMEHDFTIEKLIYSRPRIGLELHKQITECLYCLGWL